MKIIRLTARGPADKSGPTPSTPVSPYRGPVPGSRRAPTSGTRAVPPSTPGDRGEPPPFTGNAAFLEAIFHSLPGGAVVAVCSKRGDPERGGWHSMAAERVDEQCPPTANNYVCASSLLCDYTKRPIGERFEVAWLIRGGQAQRLAERAIELAGRPVETLYALAAAMAAALVEPPGLDHWLTAFDAFRPDPYDDDDENVAASPFEDDEEPPLDASSREAALELLDHLARQACERERHGKRQRSAA